MGVSLETLIKQRFDEVREEVNNNSEKAIERQRKLRQYIRVNLHKEIEKLREVNNNGIR